MSLLVVLYFSQINTNNLKDENHESIRYVLFRARRNRLEDKC